MPFRSYTDEELVNLLQQGNHEAFELLFNRYWLSTYRRLFKKLQSKSLAEEYTQELFIRLWERRTDLVIQTSIAQYLNGAVRNLVVTNIRAEIKHKLMLEHARHELNTGTDPSDQLVTNLHQALIALPNKTGDIIKLAKLDGLSIKEIATQQNLSHKAVEYHITKALKMLKAYFKNLKNAAALALVFLTSL